MLVIIDGNNLFIRNFVINPTMGVNGERIGGYIGTLRSTGKLLDDFKPSQLLFVWDGEGGSQRRKSIYSEYKSGRTVRLNKEYDFGESPEESLQNMRHQVAMARDHLGMLGISQVRCDGVEADDLIAHAATSLSEDRCVIVSTDQDMLQLIDARISVFSPIKRIMFDKEKFVEVYGILPSNYRIMKALCGDKSDNIPGIKGFGEKTVSKSFPRLAIEESVSPASILEDAKGSKSVACKRLVEQETQFRENLTLMDLSNPMLSAHASRDARVALESDLPCREMEFRISLMRSGVTSTDERLTVPFKEFARRKKFAKLQHKTEIESK